MKILFFGTPEYVVPILEALHETYNRGRERQLIGVVTQPPKPVGREKKVEYSAVDHFAHKHKVPIFHSLEELPTFDLGICAAYGKIIPLFVIQNARLGILNVHPSLLPQFRGASPIQATIISGEAQTGVTILKMDALMDHGPIVSSFKDEVLPEDNNESLRTRLFEKTAPFLIELIPSYISGKVKLKPQDETKATFTKIITREDGFIQGKYIEAALTGSQMKEKIPVRFMPEFSAKPDAEHIVRTLRAMSPWPGIWTSMQIGEQTKRLKIHRAHIEDNLLRLDEVQLEGKNTVSWEQFKQGYPHASFN